MNPPPHGDWQVPGPPGPVRRPINGARVAAGIGAALLAHALTLLVLTVGVVIENDDVAVVGLLVALIGQGLALVGCLAIGIVLIVRREPGFGIGLLIGWAVGLLIVPFAGFGLCVQAIERNL